jgi:hypothetical protein
VSNRSQFAAWLKAELQDDDSALSDVELDHAIERALHEYSDRRNRIAVHDYAGDGIVTTFAAPTSWEDGWSVILSVELPQGNEPATYLGKTGYSIYRDLVTGVVALKLRFASAPASGDVARVLYTARHTASNTATTVPPVHQRAVGTLGASLASEMLASRYAPQSDSTLGVDIADHAARSGNYADRAKRLREIYDGMVPRQYARSVTIMRA